MEYLKKSFLYINKSQRFGLYLLFILILLFEILQNFTFKKVVFELTDSDKVLLAQYKNESKLILKDSIQNFNPNDLQEEDWMKLGFSQKQAVVILNYKELVGGKFLSKEQLRKCYVIDEKKYFELEPFLLLPDRLIKEKKEYSLTKSTIAYKNFNPNDLPQQGWEKLGFTSRQAEVIMKYKQLVGGKFTSKEQLRKCYVIDDVKYAEMQSYMLLPNVSKKDLRLEKTQANKDIVYTKFDPNDFSVQDWKKIGFSHKQAESILKYKKILGGKFISKEQLKKCYIVSDQKFIEIEPYLIFSKKEENNLTNPKKVEELNDEKIVLTQKFNPNDLTKEDWLKLGFTEKQVSTIFNFKKSLGGKFTEKTLKKCYAISEEKYRKIEPFLIY